MSTLPDRLYALDIFRLVPYGLEICKFLELGEIVWKHCRCHGYEIFFRRVCDDGKRGPSLTFGEALEAGLIKRAPWGERAEREERTA